VERGTIMSLRLIIGVVVGGLLGFALYRFVGCSTGACPLTSNPWISTLYGMILGALFAGSF
jgi:Na+-transporting NADH:ubiquinone oxidoreductase subunit NqrB